MANVRFRDLVAKAGRPVVVTLWSDPRKDSGFMKAVGQNRVLTIFREPEAVPFGRWGFHQDPHASYLVFPKRLPPASKAKVIGIKFELLEPPPKGTHPRSEVKPSPPPKASRSRPEKSFHFKIRREAILESSVTVLARNPVEARKKAIAEADSEPFDIRAATMRSQATLQK